MTDRVLDTDLPFDDEASTSPFELSGGRTDLTLDFLETWLLDASTYRRTSRRSLDDAAAAVEQATGTFRTPLTLGLLLAGTLHYGLRGMTIPENAAIGYAFALPDANNPPGADPLRCGLIETGCTLVTVDSEEGQNAFLLPETKRLDILSLFGTDGANYDVWTEQVASWLDHVAVEYPLILHGCGHDWLEARIIDPRCDWERLALWTAQFAPDIVTQGTETLEALVAEMTRRRKVYLWWD